MHTIEFTLIVNRNYLSVVPTRQ